MALIVLLCIINYGFKLFFLFILNIYPLGFTSKDDINYWHSDNISCNPDKLAKGLQKKYVLLNITGEWAEFYKRWN